METQAYNLKDYLDMYAFYIPHTAVGFLFVKIPEYIRVYKHVGAAISCSIRALIYIGIHA